MDLSRSWTVSKRRHSTDPPADVPQHTSSASQESTMGTHRRVAMVPSAGRICDAWLDDRSYRLALRQLLQCRALASATRSCSPDPLLSSWRSYWTHHVALHASDVHNCACQDTKTILRDVLVHASSIHPILARHVHSCYRMLRARHGAANLAICRKRILGALYRI